MKQLWYCANVDGHARVIRCEATLDNGKRASHARVIPWNLLRESLNFQSNWIALQLIAMSNEIDRLNSSTIVRRVDEAFRAYHRIANDLPNVLYLGHAEVRAVPIGTGAYRVDAYGREWFMQMRLIRVDLPEWLQVTRIWREV